MPKSPKVKFGPTVPAAGGAGHSHSHSSSHSSHSHKSQAVVDTGDGFGGTVG